MSLLDDFKKQSGIKTVNIGTLNSKATAKRATIAGSSPMTDSALEGITITEEYEQVMKMLDSRCPVVFVSGKAGTGKSTLIQYVRHSFEGNVVVVAPTGVAALNVGGVTINSYFQLPPRITDPIEIKQVKDRRLYSRLDLLILDEISMVRADMIDAIDSFLRKNARDKTRPFGGTRLLLVGDLFQLPPVVTQAEEKILKVRGYESPYFFSAKSLQSCDMAVIELTEIFRQRDHEFTSILNNIRVAQNLESVVPALNERCYSDADECSVITLTSTNAVADETNFAGLAKLDGIEQTYHGKIEGTFAVEEDRLPSPLNLSLKVGAQVMFTKNDEEKRWVNGTLGKVVGLSEKTIQVELNSENAGNVVDVQPVVWESYRYQFNGLLEKILSTVAGRYVQYPLMLAWAVTIHKSQGKTLEKVKVDLGTGAFASGQVYVALSRCRSVEDIQLTRPIVSTEVKCDPVILRFSEILSG